MPVHTGKDAKGCFAQWGGQKKYYYECGNTAAMKRARAKAEAQGRAVRSTGWTEHQEGEPPMAKVFANIVTNIKPLVRNDKMEGRDYLVVPTVMMTEGVHNGSHGPILYPAEELAKLPLAWNHKPVIVYHSQRNGQFISACDPIELTSRKIGVVMNTAWDNKLKTESWLEPSRIEAVDKRVGEALQKGEMTEVSIGVYMDQEATEGEWNGEPYIGIARNLVPDHLAILPDQTGACSIADGAGLLRANSENDDPQIVAVHRIQDGARITLNELGHNALERLLRQALVEKRKEAWIEEVYDTQFIFSEGGQLYRMGYEEKDGGITLTGDADEVVLVREYRTQGGAFIGNTKKGSNMDRKKLIDGLIANQALSFTEEDRKGLEQMSDDGLQFLVDRTKEPEQPAEPPAPSPNADPAPANPPAPVSNTPPTPPAKLRMEDLPEDVQRTVRNAQAIEAREKDRLIGIITGNKRCRFTAEGLRLKDVPELNALAELAAEPQPEGHTIPLYTGQAPVDNAGQITEEPLPIPTMNFSKSA